jgi:hypothetical protein
MTTAWSLCSHFKPLDILLCGYVKDEVHNQTVNMLDDSEAQITAVQRHITVRLARSGS